MTPEEVAASYKAQNSEEEADDDGENHSQIGPVADDEHEGGEADHSAGSVANPDAEADNPDPGGSAHADEQAAEPVF